MSRRQDYAVRVARRLLVAYERGPRWLRHVLPDGAYVALLRPVQAQEDREAAAIYTESCRRAREAWIAQREAMGPGCPYCPNEELTSYDADGDRYHECPACGAAWPIGPSPDGDNPYDELRPLDATAN
jgi:hypothetical protein